MLLQVSQLTLRVRNVRRLQLVFFQLFSEVTEPRHAPPRVRTHVETSAAPSRLVYATFALVCNLQVEQPKQVRGFADACMRAPRRNVAVSA